MIRPFAGFSAQQQDTPKDFCARWQGSSADIEQVLVSLQDAGRRKELINSLLDEHLAWAKAFLPGWKEKHHLTSDLNTAEALGEATNRISIELKNLADLIAITFLENQEVSQILTSMLAKGWGIETDPIKGIPTTIPDLQRQLFDLGHSMESLLHILEARKQDIAAQNSSTNK